MGYSDDIVIDPEFKALIPPLSADERALLEESVAADGVRDALRVWNCAVGSVLLDGHNRHEIAQRLGIECGVAAVEGVDTRDDAVVWIIRNQLGRRNLDPSTRVLLANRLAPLLRKKGEANKAAAGGDRKSTGSLRMNVDEPITKVDTIGEVARIAGVCRATAYNVLNIESRGVPELKAAVKSKEVSIHAAREIAKLPEKEQRSALAGGPKVVIAKAKEIQTTKAQKSHVPIVPQTDERDTALRVLRMIIPDLKSGNHVDALAKIKLMMPQLLEHAKGG